ncbi:amino acid adenylation domain-containing protein [Ekhidna sp.]|uniref:amino acid adenylation domain-containing protein n=1 Tax=Ekhidna sp. TaxID=2608089 RepID=UPI003CCBBB11
MKSLDILKVIYQAHQSGIWLWCKNGELKFRAPKEKDISGVLKKVRDNKAGIIEMLEENQVFEQGQLQTLMFPGNNKKSVLSFAQERLWFVEQFERGTNAYHLPLLFELEQGTDVKGLKYALEKVVMRHEILRSTIDQGEEGKGIQTVNDDLPKIEEIEVGKSEEVENLLKTDINRPFDLNKEYPIRIKFYRVSSFSQSITVEERVILMINIHHIASDGWSQNILMEEVLAYYKAYLKQDYDFSLPPLTIQYKDYAFWQKAYLSGAEMEKQVVYWKEKLAGYETLAFPTDYGRPAQVSYSGANESFKVDQRVSEKLKALAKTKGTTMFSVLLSGLNILLGKYSGQEDIVVGSPNANRHYPQTVGLIGPFLNVQVNRSRLIDGQSFAQLIDEVHREQIASQRYQDLPFEKLVDELEKDRDLSRHPVFQIMFEVYGNHRAENKYLKPFKTSSLYEAEKFDFTITIDDSAEELEGIISYATSLFSRETIIRLVQHYAYLLSQLVDDPNKAYSKISLLDPSEYSKIVTRWNDTAQDYPPMQTLHELFEAQVNKTPDNVALVYEEEKLTYSQLNEKSNQLARQLKTEYERRNGKTICPNTLIPLYLDRSLEMMIGILAVLKTGGAYVPIDVAYPQCRVDYVIEDIDASIILTRKKIPEINDIELPSDKVFYVDLIEEYYQTEANSNLSPVSTQEDLAYVIFTSGTIGKPKGVMIEHKSVHNMIHSLTPPYGIEETSKVLLFSSYSFDTSVEVIWPTLCSGAELFLLHEEKRFEKAAFEKFIMDNRITHFDATPGFLRQIEPKTYSNLKGIIAGGEVCDWNLARQWSPLCEFLNTYGPTENTVTSTINLVDPSKGIVGHSVPIGKPVANTQAYIFNQSLQLQPIGIPGELCLGGVQLARGYLNQSELTKEKFIDHPFREGERLYKTGDLARWLPDGTIEFLGRNDDQVKIRGYRIELGEIENQLTSHLKVEGVAVIVHKKNMDKKLVVYFVAREDVEVQELDDYLRERLPDYMIPSAMVRLDQIPLTVQGKLNRRALPPPDWGSQSDEYRAPSNDTEFAICKIWRSVIGLDRVGVLDDFFRIGGNSILAMQVSHQMSLELNCEIRVADIFKHKTISELLSHNLGQTQMTIPKIKKNNAMLSFAQERLWFIEEFEKGTNAYHIPLVLSLGKETDQSAVVYALQQIVSRHEVLRSTIQKNEEGEGIQVVGDDNLTIEEENVAEHADLDALIRSDIKKPFILSKDYPIRVKFYTIVSSDSSGNLDEVVLLINIHHIASDGWSLDIFQNELLSFYEAYVRQDLSFSLAPLPIQYKDYAAWQRTQLTEATLANQIDYWKQRLSGFETLAIPTDHSRPNQVDYRGAREYFVIDEETSVKVRKLAKSRGTTLYSVLLGSLKILLGKYSGQRDIVVGSPIANRGYHQTAKLIGFFINSQVSRTVLNHEQSYCELIDTIHQDQVSAQFHQDLPFDKLVDELKIDRDLSRHPIFQVMFGVQSFGDFRVEKDHSTPFRVYDGTVIGEVAKFDLSLFIDDGKAQLQGSISYATSLFEKSTIKRIVAQYQYLLARLVSSPHQSYSQMSLLSPADYRQIVMDWNATDREYSKSKTIHELFEAQAARAPDHVAIVFGGEELTYGQLNSKSNQLARHIKNSYAQKVGDSMHPGTFIGLCVDRSLEMVIATLAVLKAGGAYLPLDPDFPEERIDYMLKDTKAPLVLTQRHLYDRLSAVLKEDQIIPVDLNESLYIKEKPTNLPSETRATDLCYVIYTSGTTGKPKGVIVSHTSVVNFIEDNIARFDLNEHSRCLHTTSMTFDAGTGHLFRSILAGGKLFIMKKHVNALETARRLEITHLSVSAAVLNGTEDCDVPSLRILTTGGESLHESKMNYWIKRCKVFNSYGPTEATIGTMFNQYTQGDKATNIGKAINNTRCYVLDEDGACVPVGVVGELFIGGACLALGYLNNEKLTNERFVPNTFARAEDIELGYTKLYKTGDLVKWSQNGELEYIGRKDSQVKIRGYRIELGEVEDALSQVEGVKQSHILVKELDSNIDSKYLVGYYVPEESADDLTEEGIFRQLSYFLPDYMLPTTLVAMDRFPITTNGKLDHKALPNPIFNTTTSSHRKPSSELEISLCEAYSEVLGVPVEQIGTDQNFFKIGGNSILSIKLKARLNKLEAFKDIGVADLFKYNTINKLVDSIQNKKSDQYYIKETTFDGDHEIAIIGTSGAFSGAKNVAELWNMVANQREGLKKYSIEECRALNVSEQLLQNPQFVPVSGEVDGVELFDSLFWGLSPAEARQFDPQIRKFMEHCWIVLESTGYANERKKRNIGVFGGIGASNYLENNVINGEQASKIQRWEAAMSNIKDALATKVSFHLGLTGPAYAINTACSTGLVSVVEACQKLAIGVCDMALAGGSSLHLPREIGYLYQKGMTLSKDGQCRTFDKMSTGTASGSGSGVVLLKRLKDAIEEKDTILGVIKGYATNNDGDRKTFYSAPSVVGQSECIVRAQKMAGVKSEEVSYVECHGTATNLGDPIEVQGLREAFNYNKSNKKRTHKTVLGSVKANIGHTDTAAGIAGLIKVCSMLQHDIIPGQVNFSQPNPELRLEQSIFEVLVGNKEWLPSNDKQRIAGVSAFGIGGTNAHVVIGDYIPAKNDEASDSSKDKFLRNDQESRDQYHIVLSAKSKNSLDALREKLLNYLEQNNSVDIKDVAYTLQERREHFVYRSAYTSQHLEELTAQLRGGAVESLNAQGANKVVLMFPGQGTQYAGMAKTLYESSEVFRKALDECISNANQHLELDIREILFPEEHLTSYHINQTQWSQITLFIIEFALAKLLKSLGVKADAYIGHSLGEFVAATLSGVFQLKDAIKVVIARGRLMQEMTKGSMLAVNAEVGNVQHIVDDHHCEIAVINSSDDLVISGDKESILNLQKDLEERKISTVELNTSHAFHSESMEDASIEFNKTLGDVHLHRPNKMFISNLTGLVAGDEVVESAYWSKQLRNTVLFSKGVDTICKTYNHNVTFIEVGPGRGLSYFANKKQQPGSQKNLRTVQLLPSHNEAMEKPIEKPVSQETIISKLWMSGVISKPNSPEILQGGKLLTQLPGYQFDFQKCWLEKSTSAQDKKFNAINDVFYERIWERKRSEIPFNKIEELKNSNVLFLINDEHPDQTGSSKLLELFGQHCDDLDYVIHKQSNSIKPETMFDLGDEEDIATILSDKTKKGPLKRLIYVSPSINLSNPALDIFAIRNVFDWSKTRKGQIEAFASISFDNYEVLGVERLQEKPSIVTGVTKSILSDYFTSSTKTMHIDIQAEEINIANLWHMLNHVSDEDLLVSRGKYCWRPVYKQVSGLKNKFGIDGNVFLITGGLGALGYAFARHLTQRVDRCTLFLIGRREEASLQGEYRKRLDTLLKSDHKIIYLSADVGEDNCLAKLRGMITEHNVQRIHIALHAAGVVAKSAVYEKSKEDINEVVNPKVNGIDTLIKLAELTPITHLVSCSSLSSIIPSLGNMEYTAANLYLDEISTRNVSNVDSLLAININHVSDAGAAVNFIDESKSEEEAVSNSIRSDEFPYLLDRVIGQNISCLGISRYDIETLASTIVTDEQTEKPSSINEAKVIDESCTEEEFKMAQIFAQVLGLEEVSLHDDFFAIGGNSIHAIQISHRINKELDKEVKISDLFASKSIKELLSQSKPKSASELIKKVF